jgi:glutathione S-transferase
MDSRKIADYLEAHHPSPPLHLDSPITAEITRLLVQLNTRERLIRIYMPLVPQLILAEYPQEYWHRTRGGWIGQSLGDLEKSCTLEQAFAACAPVLAQITALLKGDAGGPFFMGETVSYADFVWGAYFVWMREMGEDFLDMFVKATGDEEASWAFYKALEPWWKRNDH